MEKKSGGNGGDGLRESAEEFPVIDLIDVVNEDSEDGGQAPGVSYDGGDDCGRRSIEDDLDVALGDSFKLPDEDFSALPGASDDEFTFTGDIDDIDSAGFEGPFSMDEKRLEAMITRIVEDVVTRVTRETVAQVTEKVLSSAIEAMRDNLEDPSK